jgi:hypothetical protein
MNRTSSVVAIVVGGLAAIIPAASVAAGDGASQLIIRPGVSIGPLRLGASHRALTRRFPNLKESPGIPGIQPKSQLNETLRLPAGMLHLGFYHGRLESIDSSSHRLSLNGRRITVGGPAEARRLRAQGWNIRPCGDDTSQALRTGPTKQVLTTISIGGPGIDVSISYSDPGAFYCSSFGGVTS